MITYDFSPLFRSSVGFDRVQKLLETATQIDQGGNGYPPYNIEATDENAYRVTMAVAGFEEDELSVEAHENILTVSGNKKEDKSEVQYLHRGIARRDFVRKFQLADYVKVTGAKLVNGLLHVDLVREVPEEAKPRRIEIAKGDPEGLAAKAKKLIDGAGKKVA